MMHMQEEAYTVLVGKATKKKRLALLAGVASTIIALGAAGTWRHTAHRYASPVPKSITSSVSFPIYYPDQSKLPAGYTLDASSFKQPVQNGVNYTVDYGNRQELVFSLQPKPPASELQNFVANYIPLHNSFQAPTGQALLGAYNTKTGTETLVSLPTGSNTWIIITAPYNINQDQLKQVIGSLIRS